MKKAAIILIIIFMMSGCGRLTYKYAVYEGGVFTGYEYRDKYQGKEFYEDERHYLFSWTAYK